jgi:NADPH:quinone reductase-like Zn-dependent oxidoreductase
MKAVVYRRYGGPEVLEYTDVPDPKLSHNRADHMLQAGLGESQHFEDMNRFIEEHRITPVVDRDFAFDEALHAFAHMAEQRHFGKLAINVAGDQAS